MVVNYVLPLIKGILTDVVKYRNTVDNFIKLLAILVYVTAAVGIVSMISSIGDPLTGYITLANPALEIINGIFFPTLKLLVIGVGILLVAERIKLK